MECTFSAIIVQISFLLRVARRLLAAPADLRKAWMWDEFPEIAKKLNDVADAMAQRGFREEAADLFERQEGGCVGTRLVWVGSREAIELRVIFFSAEVAEMMNKYLVDISDYSIFVEISVGENDLECLHPLLLPVARCWLPERFVMKQNFFVTSRSDTTNTRDVTETGGNIHATIL